LPPVVRPRISTVNFASDLYRQRGFLALNETVPPRRRRSAAQLTHGGRWAGCGDVFSAWLSVDHGPPIGGQRSRRPRRWPEALRRRPALQPSPPWRPRPPGGPWPSRRAAFIAGHQVSAWSSRAEDSFRNVEEKSPTFHPYRVPVGAGETNPRRRDPIRHSSVPAIGRPVFDVRRTVRLGILAANRPTAPASQPAT